MKIVIEASVTGLAQLYETARTGIYRVISSLSQKLLANSDIDIQYSGLSSIEVNTLTNNFFKNLQLDHRRFNESVAEEILVKMAHRIPGGTGDGLPAKLLSRMYRDIHRNRIFKECDIYHSMYDALPKYNSRYKTVRMMTIYDIIPLLFPDYFEEKFIERFRRIVTSFIKNKDFLFTISENSRKDVSEYFGMDPQRIIVTPLAASPTLYFPVSDVNLIEKTKIHFGLQGNPYFLTLATIEKRKNLQTSIAAFKKIINEPDGKDFHFVLIGTVGWKVEKLLKEIQEDKQLRDRVHFTGFIEDKYLSALYSGATGFVYPSFYEGFGLPPLEAMQCGVPVICSNTSSLPEVVGDAGILVDPGDADGIAEAMKQLITNDSVRIDYSQKGIKRAQQFSWKSCAEKTIEGYRFAWNNRS